MTTPEPEMRLVPVEPTKVEVAAFREWYFQHTGKRIFAANARKALLAVRAAAPASPPETGWRTMETAPKDGARFWGRVGDDALSMLWHEGFGAFVTCWRRMQMAPGYLIDGKPYKDHSPDIQKPTAWMPLPTPPSSGREGEAG